MPVTYQSIGTQATTTSTAAVSWPTGHAVDDIGILVIESGGGTFTTPSGWNDVATSTASGTQLNIYWRRATSAAESAASVTVPTGGDHLVARIATFRGCIPSGSPILTSATSVKNFSSTSWSAPAITTTTSSEFVVWGVSRDNDISSTTIFGNPVNTNLVSPTEIGEAGTVSANGGGFTVGYGVKTTAGNTGDTTGITSLISVNASITFSLQASGTLSAARGVFTFLGRAADLRINRLIASTGTFTETGNAAVLAKAFKLTPASAGTFTETGNAAVLAKAFKLAPADRGTFIETGNAANLSRGLKLASLPGLFNEDGNNAALAVGRIVTGSTGVFSFTGNAATFTKTTASKTLLADAGAFTSTGNDAGFNLSRKLTSSTGAYSETGNAAGLQATRKAMAASGAFTLTGNAAAFGLARKVSASPGNFALVGNNATFGNIYTIQCSPSAFTVTGADARVFKTRRRLINF